ncbi:hypothetical protein [Neglectibacter timonensis]|uniref:hypothetical protein n=1 Tax=Neglectibacter timonensis TaxID=1776382 RepID=UPI0012B64F59|nr:hypothetical protein [Neglectibacter timonensis]MCQ4845488.1 hypothetical protein [Neglectibacter timonensis]MEE0729152.1 hypothetical protein [Oscillospiraceae bacterium]
MKNRVENSMFLHEGGISGTRASRPGCQKAPALMGESKGRTFLCAEDCCREGL